MHVGTREQDVKFIDIFQITAGCIAFSLQFSENDWQYYQKHAVVSISYMSLYMLLQYGEQHQQPGGSGSYVFTQNAVCLLVGMNAGRIRAFEDDVAVIDDLFKTAYETPQSQKNFIESQRTI